MENISVNTGTGVLFVRKITPVISALFGLFHLEKIKKQKGCVYISRRKTDEVDWEKIKGRISRVLPNFNFDVPSNDLCMTG